MATLNIKKLVIAIATAFMVIIAGSLLVYLLSGRTAKTEPTSTEPTTESGQASRPEIEKLRETLFSEEAKQSIADFKKSLFLQTEIEKSIGLREEKMLEPPPEKKPTESEKFLQSLKSAGVSNIEVGDEEVFQRLDRSSENYALAQAQDFLITEGYIKEEERVPLNSEQNVVNFWVLILGRMLEQGWIEQAGYNQLTNYLQNGWLELRSKESQRAREQIRLEKIGNTAPEALRSPGGPRDYQSPKIAVSPVLKILEYLGLTNILRIAFDFVRPAESEAVFYWSTTPNLPVVPLTGCAKNTGDLDKKAGPTRWAPCCNCGLFCAKSCTFHADCGVRSTKCNIHLGCLNALFACGNYRAAIWDDWLNITEGTGVCACG